MPTAVATETADEQNAEFWELIRGSGLVTRVGAQWRKIRPADDHSRPLREAARKRVASRED